MVNHFPDVGKMVGLCSGSKHEVDDIMLTCYAYIFEDPILWKIMGKQFLIVATKEVVE